MAPIIVVVDVACFQSVGAARPSAQCTVHTSVEEGWMIRKRYSAVRPADCALNAGTNVDGNQQVTCVTCSTFPL